MRYNQLFPLYIGILYTYISNTMFNIIDKYIFFFVLLLGVSLLTAKHGRIERPGTVVKFVTPILHDMQKYAKLEVKLEDITDESNMYEMSKEDRNWILRKLLQMTEVQNILEECRKFHVPIDCSDTQYRTMDGSCNNLKYPEFGKTIIEHRRLLPANYEGTNGFRKSVTGNDLPNARRISLSLPNFRNPSSSVSAMFTFFGQLIAHDVSMTPELTKDGNTPNCCDPSKKSSPFCFPVDIPDDDPFYKHYNVTCQGFARAAPYPKCNFAEKRGVINKKSAFIDASAVYGDSEDQSKKLRTNDGTGRLRTQETKFGELLPKNHNNRALFCPVTAIEKCFEAGDERVNQHSLIMSLQTIYLRLHNNFADALIQLNPNWDDDRIFQESRRIVIALHQHVIYNEYLSLFIGPDNMEKFDLYPDLQTGSPYNAEVDPSILTEFNTAAFRPHSMVPTYFSGNMPRLKFKNIYSNVRPVHRGRLDSLLSGTCELPSENNDEFVTDDVSNFLYKGPGESYGGDMTSIDIQRGRDVGLPSYIDMLHFCFNDLRIQDFSGLSNSGLMTEENVQGLVDTYEDIRDIDLIVGLLREIRGNAALGPTASCIASIQFNRLKFGDSFFYTHTNGRNPFTKGQLDMISSYSLARILCETTDMEIVRSSPLRIPSKNNPLVPCNTFPPIDVSSWNEESPMGMFLSLGMSFS